MLNPYNKNETPLLVFIHIPKTGGQTLWSIVCKNYKAPIQYSGEAFPLLANKLEAVDALGGHIYFGIHAYLQRPVQYITMIRNPVEQSISWFYYAEGYKHMTLEQYVNSSGFPSNMQTRYLTDDMSLNLPKAKENIEKYISIVGVTEFFNESLYLMKKELNWKNIEYTKLNVNPNRPSLQDISPNIIKVLQEKNDLDFQLYDYAVATLKNRIS